MSAELEQAVRRFGQKIAEWRLDPCAFARELFGFQPDRWQARVLSAFARQKKIAMKACKGPGKTALLALIGLNFFFTRPDPKIICTSITGDNLKDGLWTEFSVWLGRIRPEYQALRELVEVTGGSIYMREAPETWFISPRSWPKDADKSKQANSMAGIHGDYTLVLLDEVSDYPDGVVVAAEASLSTGRENKLVVAGNPTKCEGPLWRACTTERAQWWLIEITGDPDDPDRAPRISVEWARSLIASWGRDNPWVLTNVFGQFPPTQSNKLLGPEDVSLASRREVGDWLIYESAKVLGIDVARMGDDRSVATPRQGALCRRQSVWRNLRLTELADQVISLGHRWGLEDGRPVDGYLVDDTGVGGGLTDMLLRAGLPVIAVNNGGKAQNDKRFESKWDEMWWEAADWIKKQGELPNDPELLSELQAPTYTFDTPGQRLRVEHNKDLKKKLGKSLDLASSFINTFAYPVRRREVEEALRQSGPRVVRNTNPLGRRA